MRTYVLFAITILVAVVMGLVNVHPKEADSNAAAWLDLVGLSSWGEGVHGRNRQTDYNNSLGYFGCLCRCDGYTDCALGQA